MEESREIEWFIKEFGKRVEQGIEGTPFTVPMFAGIAYQETGYLWSRIRKNTDDEEGFLNACVGDIIGGPRRKAFPRKSKDLIQRENGSAMFEIARDALAVLGEIAPEYSPYVRHKERFCRGYGLFQYDLQFFKVDPEYFLKRGWSTFDGTFGKAVSEATEKAKLLGLYENQKLTITEATKVAIAYNRGSYDSSKGWKQGHRNDQGEYYGELVNRYIKLATRLLARSSPTSPGLNSGRENSLGSYMVNARSGLILRAAPSIESTRLMALPEGQVLTVLGFSGDNQNWALVDLEGDGLADGFMASAFLVKE